MRTITGIDVARRPLTSRAAYDQPALPPAVFRPWSASAAAIGHIGVS